MASVTRFFVLALRVAARVNRRSFKGGTYLSVEEVADGGCVEEAVIHMPGNAVILVATPIVKLNTKLSLDIVIVDVANGIRCDIQWFT